MKLWTRRNIERAIIALAAAVLVFFLTGEPSRLEYGLLDLRFSLSGSAHSPVTDVAVILVDPPTEAALGSVFDSSWREHYPQLIRTVREAGARAIIWDFAFAASEPEIDPVLAAALEGEFPVVAAEDPASRTTPALRNAFTELGSLVLVAGDSLPRRVPPSTDLPPLSVIAAGYLPDAPQEAVEIPAEGLWIDYSHDLSEIPRFSMIDVLSAADGRLADELQTSLFVFRNRVVFIGQDLPASDRYALPRTGGVRVPGVLAQVAATLTVAQERQITRLPRWLDWLLATVVALMLVVGGTQAKRLVRRVTTTIGVVVGILLAPVLFALFRVWVSYGAMLVAVILPLVAIAVVRRLWLGRSYRTSLGFDPALIQQHQNLIESYSTGVEREAAVLCSDVRNYTQFVTDHSPDVVQRVMTEYMAAMEQVVDAHGGYVNKYVGDEIVAVFGFPLAEREAVARSVRAALAMLDTLSELQKSWGERGLPALEAIGIGLDAGAVRFTHIGGRHRVQFDVIGNPINGASRLQTLTKEHGRPLMLPAEIVEAQDELDVVMYGATESSLVKPAVTFVGEVMVRGQGRRRVYGLAQPGTRGET
jgi:adenylate cyclase